MCCGSDPGKRDHGDGGIGTALSATACQEARLDKVNVFPYNGNAGHLGGRGECGGCPLQGPDRPRDRTLVPPTESDFWTNSPFCVRPLTIKFLHNEQGFRNALFLCHEPFDWAQDRFHELTRKRKKLVKIRVIRGKKPLGSGLSRLGYHQIRALCVPSCSRNTHHASRGRRCSITAGNSSCY